MNVRDALRQAGALIDALDAQLLLADLLQRDRGWLFAWPEFELSAEQQAAFEHIVERRAAGEPAAHITGRREFWGLSLKVTPDTLIPRPETELLVETALQLLPAGQPARVLDLGTGSGAIAAAIASERPHWQVVATDISTAALAVARQNFAALGLTNIEPRIGCWFDPIAAGERFELILCNPPYIADDDPQLADDVRQHEPAGALIAANDGLADLRQVIEQAAGFLQPAGWLAVEHGFAQAAPVKSLFEQAGYQALHCSNDLAGHPRVSLARR